MEGNWEKYLKTLLRGGIMKNIKDLRNMEINLLPEQELTAGEFQDGG
jgi:hypothetical protein